MATSVSSATHRVLQLLLLLTCLWFDSSRSQSATMTMEETGSGFEMSMDLISQLPTATAAEFPMTAGVEPTVDQTSVLGPQTTSPAQATTTSMAQPLPSSPPTTATTSTTQPLPSSRPTTATTSTTQPLPSSRPTTATTSTTQPLLSSPPTTATTSTTQPLLSSPPTTATTSMTQPLPSTTSTTQPLPATSTTQPLPPVPPTTTTTSPAQLPPSTSTSRPAAVTTTTTTTSTDMPMRPTTSRSPSEPSPTTESTEDSRILGLTVGVAVLGTAFLILAVVVLLLVGVLIKRLKRRQKKPKHHNFSPSSNKLLRASLEELDTSISLTTFTKSQPVDYRTLFAHIPGDMKAIPLVQLQERVKLLHEDDNDGAKEEYRDVKDLDPPISKIAATLPCNELKNRYTNILPDDDTRVALTSDPRIPGSDYINANYIAGYKKDHEYIATQGPIPSTIVDFWRMIWERNTRIIVMVTNLVEGDVPKCNKYWPDEGSQLYASIMVTLEDEQRLPEYIVRTLTISRTSGKKAVQVGELRKVVQYHFTAWPDFGVPDEVDSMLKFVSKIRSQAEDDHGPMVIHCSAGVGRTGTFIAIDVMLQRMTAGQALNITEFVCQMRAQRNNMVQTDAQYLFIYDAVLQAHLHDKKEVGANELEEHVAAPSHPVEGNDEKTPLDKEFQSVMDIQAAPEDATSVARSERNKRKNRNMENVALNSNRVTLFDSDANYINASFIRGSSQLREFVVTQHPLQETKGDFWKMVLERDIVTIVMIGPLGDTDSEKSYWPDEDTKEYNKISVELLSCKTLDNGIILRELQLECGEMEASVTVHQYHLLEWPLDKATPATPDGMLTLVRESRRHQEEAELEEGLIVVHSSCCLKTEAAGVYCAVSILLSQVKEGSSVDVKGVVGQLRKQRPGIITSKDCYRFIHQVVAAAR